MTFPQLARGIFGCSICIDVLIMAAILGVRETLLLYMAAAVLGTAALMTLMWLYKDDNDGR